jgi:hypothetical protein
MKKAILTLFITSLLCYSCADKPKTDKEIEAESINQGIKKIDINKNADWLVILPGLGCRGCIQEGEAFMRDYIDSPKIVFVLTKIESIKILQEKISKNIGNYPNVIVDRNDIFNLHTYNMNYPCIVQLKSGKAGDHEFQCPENSQAFEKLKSKI